MLYSGTDPESYITEYTLVYEEKKRTGVSAGVERDAADQPRPNIANTSIIDQDRGTQLKRSGTKRFRSTGVSA